MISKSKRLQDLFHEYEAHIGRPAALREAIEWGVANGKYVLPDVDPVSLAVSDMRDALRSETRLDDQGREYRVNAAVINKDGSVQASLWGSVDSTTTPHEFIVEHFGQRRKQIADDCYKLKCDIDHNNEKHGPERWYQLSIEFFDFNEDNAERRAAEDLEREKKDAAE